MATGAEKLSSRQNEVSKRVLFDTSFRPTALLVLARIEGEANIAFNAPANLQQ
jgi:hypothetical protein